MTLPMAALAIGCIYVGPTSHGSGGGIQLHGVALAGLVTPIACALLAILVYGPWRAWACNSGVDRTFVYRLLWNKYYLDELYSLVIVRPMRAIGRLFVGFDDHGIDNAVLGVTWGPRGLGWLLRIGQRGSVGGYAMCFAAGAVLIAAVVLVMRYVAG